MSESHNSILPFQSIKVPIELFKTIFTLVANTHSACYVLHYLILVVIAVYRSEQAQRGSQWIWEFYLLVLTTD